MTSSQGLEGSALPEFSPVELALEQSHQAKAKVEECAEVIGVTNDLVQKKIIDGATTLSAPKALAQSKKIEGAVQEVAVDLHKVTETLAKGIEALRELEVDLAKSKSALAESNTALETSLEAEKEARQRALHDGATGLPNRDLFDTRLEQAMSMAKRHGWTLALMFLDLDGFKRINDIHGHPVGDAVLKEIADRLSGHAREEDTVCRNGGDEFLYLLVNPQGAENTERIARNIIQRISQPIQVADRQLVVAPSIGIAVYPSCAQGAEELISLADAAMYQAKRERTGYAFDGAVMSEPVAT